MDLSKVDDSYYKANFLESIRHEINRNLKSPPNDIIKDPAFNVRWFNTFLKGGGKIVEIQAIKLQYKNVRSK